MKVETARILLQEIQDDINSDTLVLPTLPDIALKIRDVLNNKSNVSAQEISDIINTDVAIAARLIKVANSPLYRGHTEINSVKFAVTSLGNSTTCQLVTSFVIQQLFTPKSSMQAQYFRSIWDHSLNVSSICRAFTMFCPELNPDQAMLAGLVHQIGKLPVLKSYEKIAQQHYDNEMLLWILEKAHPIIGQIILKNWNFPQELISVPGEYCNFIRQGTKTPDYVDLVQVSFLQSIVGTDDSAANLDWSSVPAFAKLGFTPEMNELDNIDLSEEIDSVLSMFEKLV